MPGLCHFTKNHALLRANIHHARSAPVTNSFFYDALYVGIDLRELARKRLPFAYNRSAWLSFHDQDYGPRDGSCLWDWLKATLATHVPPLGKITQQAILLAQPRRAGFIFNPVAFYFCLDTQGKLRGVLADVTSTFKEHHTYICAHPDASPIHAKQAFTAQKALHVSPFLERTGTYMFRFSLDSSHCRVGIVYKNQHGKAILRTGIAGEWRALDARARASLCFSFPPGSIASVLQIHWQALKLFAKGVRYVEKPAQGNEHYSVAHPLYSSAHPSGPEKCLPAVDADAPTP